MWLVLTFSPGSAGPWGSGKHTHQSDTAGRLNFTAHSQPELYLTCPALVPGAWFPAQSQVSGNRDETKDWPLVRVFSM